MHNNFLLNLNNNRFYLETIHNRIASGQMVNRPSDNPAAASRIMTLRSALNEMHQHNNNMYDARSWLEISDNALNNAGAIFHRAREIAIYGAGGTMTTEQMGALADEIDQMLENLVQIANTTHGSSHVFGGTNTTSPPFRIERDNDGNITEIIFTGDSAPREFEVSPGVRIMVNSTDAFQLGGAVDGDDVLEEGLFGVLFDLSNLLRTGNVEELSNRIIGDNDTYIDGAMSHILSERASLGARSNRMAMALRRNIDAQFEFTQTMSRLADTDYAREMINFSVQQVAFQATVMSGAQILQPSLLDFLR